MKYCGLWIALFVSTLSFAQTNIDVIRASNYYSKAVDAYDKAQFQKSFDFLKQAEINLKGKTNDDLVFLKIMTQYKLENYDAAYDLMLRYFNGDFKRNRLFFKNVTNYRKKHNISYDQYLTEQFVDIENKYNLSKGINLQLSPEAIAMRIVTEKKGLIPFMRDAVNTEDISLSFRKSAEQNGEKTYRTETVYFNVEKKVLQKSVWLNGRSGNTNFTVACSFQEEFNLNTEAFYYTFSHNRCEPTRLILGWNDTVGGQVKKGMYDLSSKKFINTKKEVNSITFTDEEKEYLGKGDHFEKLKQVLKKQGF